jgi:dTDP-glucose 4,6-dehydratase
MSFEEGLEKTVDWYLANPEWMDRVITGEYEKYYENQYMKRT